MIRRTTWIFLALFLIALAGAYYLQNYQKQKTASITPTPGAEYVFTFKEPEIQGLRILNAAGKRVSLQRDAKGLWSLTEPKADATNVGQAEEAVTGLMSLTVLAKLDPAPAPQDVGLANASQAITVTVNGGKQVVAKVGNQTPTQSGYYLQVDQGPIVVVNKFSLDPILTMAANPPVAVIPTAVITTTATLPAPALTPAGQLTVTPGVTATLAAPAPAPQLAVTSTVTATLAAPNPTGTVQP